MPKTISNVKRNKLSNGGVSWTARFKYRGKEESKTFPSYDDACAWKAQKLLMTKGNKPFRIRAHETPLKEILEDAKTGKYELSESALYEVPRLLSIVGDYMVGNLTKNNLSVLVTRLSEQKTKHGTPLSAGTCRKAYFAFRKAIIGWASSVNYQLPYDFQNFPVPEAWANVRDVRVSDIDLHALKLAAARLTRVNPVWPLVLVFALNTGLRRKELALLDWKHVQGKTIFIPSAMSKTKKSRTVPLNSDALDVLSKLNKSGGLVFGFDSPRQMGRQFELISTEAGRSHITLHPFRHEFITRMVLHTNIPDKEIMKMTGHENVSTFERYQRLRPSGFWDGWGDFQFPGQEAA